MHRRKGTALAASPLILFFRWIIRRYSGKKKFNLRGKKARILRLTLILDLGMDALPQHFLNFH
jgi:hypothetical protein